MSALARLHAEWQSSARDRSSGDFAKRQHARLAERDFVDARRQAIIEFAAQRGWKPARHPFTLPQLAAGRPGRGALNEYSWSPGSVMEGGSNLAWDHPDFFRDASRPYRPAGVVVHLYSLHPDPSHAHADQLAAIYGLRFEALASSWYYPGGCLAGLYTRAAEG
jgi:hypothetical protein